MSKTQRIVNQHIREKENEEIEKQKAEVQAELQARAAECDMKLTRLLLRQKCRMETRGFIANGQVQVVINVVPKFSIWKILKSNTERILDVNSELNDLLKAMNCRLFAGLIIGQKKMGQQIQVVAQPAPPAPPTPKTNDKPKENGNGK